MPIVDSNVKLIFASLSKVETRNLTVEDYQKHFNLSAPEKITTILPRKNTVILLIPKIESPYFGIKKIMYDRIHVSELGNIFVTRTTENTTHDFLDRINKNLSINLNTFDIINEPLTNTGSFQLELKINPESLVFYDGPIIVTSDMTHPPQGNNLPAGTPISYSCVFKDKYGTFSDGHGGTYTQLIEVNSADCGFNTDQTIYLTILGGDAYQLYGPDDTIGGGGAYVI